MPRLPRLTRLRDLSRREWLRLAGRTLLAVVVLGALGLVTVPFAAVAAKWQATDATRAISAQDLEAAEARSDRANLLAGYASLAANWWGGDAWTLLPVLGGAVDDVQHLTSSLAGLAHVLEEGVDVLPQVAGEGATLVGGDGAIDLEVLEEVLDDTRDLPAAAQQAVADLEAVEGTTPVVGGTLGAQRDAALRQARPAAEGLAAAAPLWDHLPDMLGASGPTNYLVAFLNPAEQHLSGGAPLSFAPMSFEDGRMVRQPPLTAVADGRAYRPLRWRKVQGNPFHHPHQRYRLTHATTAPSWSVSGRELARAWRAARHQRLDGVVALDVVALQEIVGASGPIAAPGYGLLTGSNLAERLIGSYDELTSVEAFMERNKGESVLMSTFQGRLLDGTNMTGKARALAEAAAGRHVAMFFRDAEQQSAFARAGFAGDLSDTPHDYLGVFNQATTGHKADYWQRRTVTSDVALQADGSAHVTLEVEVVNDAPPPATDVFPSFANYVRRDNQMLLASFLPVGADVTGMSVAGVPVPAEVRDFQGRPFVSTLMALAAGERRTLTVEYDVPEAAVVDGDTLTYRLDADPQGMVDPEALDVTVTWPDRFTPRDLPAGWRATGEGTRLVTPDFDEISSWEITATRR